MENKFSYLNRVELNYYDPKLVLHSELSPATIEYKEINSILHCFKSHYVLGFLVDSIEDFNDIVANKNLAIHANNKNSLSSMIFANKRIYDLGLNKFYYSDGSVEASFNKDKILHRTSGPAIEWYNGDETWYNNGLLHRHDDLPAVIGVDPTLYELLYGYSSNSYSDTNTMLLRRLRSSKGKYWYKNGQPSRDSSEPTVELDNGIKIWKNKTELLRVVNKNISQRFFAGHQLSEPAYNEIMEGKNLSLYLISSNPGERALTESLYKLKVQE